MFTERRAVAIINTYFDVQAGGVMPESDDTATPKVDQKTKIDFAVTEANGKELLFPPGDYKIGTNITIANDINLVKGARLDIQAGVTVTLSGNIRSGKYQIFTGAGTLLIGAGGQSVVYPEWWGAVGDAVTDNRPAIQKAIDSIATIGGVVKLSIPQYYYRTLSAIVISTDAVSIEGDGCAVMDTSGVPYNNNGSCIYMTETGNAIEIDGSGAAAGLIRHNRLKNLVVNAPNGTAIACHRAYFLNIENVRTQYTGQTGGFLTWNEGYWIFLKNCVKANISHCVLQGVNSSSGHGIVAVSQSNALNIFDCRINGGKTANRYGIMIDDGAGYYIGGDTIVESWVMGIRIGTSGAGVYTSAIKISGVYFGDITDRVMYVGITSGLSNVGGVSVETCYIEGNNWTNPNGDGAFVFAQVTGCSVRYCSIIGTASGKYIFYYTAYAKNISVKNNDLRLSGGALTEYRNASATGEFQTDVDGNTSIVGLVKTVLSSTRFSVQAGIAAGTTQTQGQVPLTKDINQVSVCANPNDVVTLPSAVAGMTVTVINSGAQTLQIFPASGDDLGAGVNTSTTLATTKSALFKAYNATTWVKFTN